MTQETPITDMARFRSFQATFLDIELTKLVLGGEMPGVIVGVNQASARFQDKKN